MARLLVPVAVAVLATVPALADPPELAFNGSVFGREHVNPVPRPFSNRGNVSVDTTIYLELLVPDQNGGATGKIDPDTITVTLTPGAGAPIPVLDPGQVFAAGFGGQVIHDIDRDADNGEAVYVVPDAPLQHATTYTVTVFAATFAGEPIPAANDSWAFTTRGPIANPTVTYAIDLGDPTVTWHGWFHSGLLKPNFNTSRLFDQIESYDLMDQIRTINPDVFSLQRDWPLTGDFWMNGVFDGNPNAIRELETRRVAAVQSNLSSTTLTAEDIEEGPLYGIPSGRPLSTDYHPGDVVTIADGFRYEASEVISIDDSAGTVTVQRLTTPDGLWRLDYPGSHPADNPDTPDNFTLPLTYLRRLDPVGTPRYYWSRIDDEWDLVHGTYGRRLQVNFSQTPLDLSSEPVPGHPGGNGSISPPKDWVQWHDFARELALHVIDRYGPASLDFYWSIGNEHNFNVFWSGSKDEFYIFYDVAVNGILKAFEDRGLDDARVIVGGLEAAGLGGVGWTRDALYHMSGASRKPGGGITETNLVCTDPRFAGMIANRVQAICNAHGNEGSPIDFVSIHEYEHSELAVSDMLRVRDDSLSIDPVAFDELSVCSFESTPDWIPRDDPAAQAIHLGGGYLPTWCADWMHRLVSRAETDARYARHESVLTVWPFDYNRQGISSFTGLMRVDDDGDGVEDRISTIRKDVLNYIELQARMGRELDALTASDFQGIRVAGVRSRTGGRHTFLLYSHDKYDNDSRDRTVFDVTLSLSGIPWENATVRRWRVDRDHSSPYHEFLALPRKNLYGPAEIAALEAGDELEPDGPPVDYPTGDGTLDLVAPVSVNGVTFVELQERDLDGDGWTDSVDNCPATVNPGQQDGDGDLRGTVCDCNDQDAGAWAVPVEVSGVSVVRLAPDEHEISWTSQAMVAGPDTIYDLADGSLLALRADGGFGAAACLADGHGEPPFLDTAAPPTAGDGRYVLIRAANVCGAADYGQSSLVPDPRDGLDPCP